MLLGVIVAVFTGEGCVAAGVTVSVEIPVLLGVMVFVGELEKLGVGLTVTV